MMVEARWRGRPVLGAIVRAGAYVVPMLSSILTSAVVSRALPAASGVGEAVAWWTVVLSSSAGVALVVQRLARRLLPLGALLSLSLVFPDRAPSRFHVAVRAGGTRKLEERIAAARAGHPGATPAEAAQAVLELATLLSAHDRRTRGHCERVRVFADLLGEELQLPPGDRDRLRWAALLHDIGKLSVSADILNKDGKPDAAEWAELQRHPDEATVFLEPVAEWLGPWTKAATEHHERWDGTGYPRKLAGTEIGLAARIVAVADSYEVMTATRAYKKPISAPEARAELARCAGSQFDPSIVRAFLTISLGRLRMAAGPLSWLAQIPFLGELPRLAGGTTTLPNAALIAKTSVATSAMAAGAGAAAAAAVVVAAPVDAEPPPAIAPTAVVASSTNETPAAETFDARSAEAASRTRVTVTTTSLPVTTTSLAPTTAPPVAPAPPAPPVVEASPPTTVAPHGRPAERPAPPARGNPRGGPPASPPAGPPPRPTPPPPANPDAGPGRGRGEGGGNAAPNPNAGGGNPNAGPGSSNAGGNGGGPGGGGRGGGEDTAPAGQTAGEPAGSGGGGPRGPGDNGGGNRGPGGGGGGGGGGR